MEQREIVTNYSIEHIQAIIASNFVMVSQFNQINVFEVTAAGTSDDPVYSSIRSGDYSTISGVDFDQKSWILMVFGIGFGETYEISSFDTSLCHPACSGCTKPFSSYHCSSCDTGTALIDS